MLKQIKMKVNKIKRDIFVLYLASRHPNTPWYAKLFALGVVAYAFSPIDLIPDFIPILGYVDDLIIVPLGIIVALRLVPHSIIKECREKAEGIARNGKPKNWVVGAIFIMVWIILAVWLGRFCYEFLTNQ